MLSVAKKSKSIRGVLTTLMLTGIAPLACAQTPGMEDNGGVGIRMGVGDHYKRATLGYETPTLWRHDFGGNWGHINLAVEMGVSYWSADGSRSPGNVWQLHAIPMLRWWLGESFYLEAGVGPTVFNKTTFSDKAISTAFQFGDQIGIGYLFNPNNRLSLRYSHFSNAGIKTSNPGLDVTELTYTYLF